jgi:SMI1 / KNR4 family (SUKH-1)
MGVLCGKFPYNQLLCRSNFRLDLFFKFPSLIALVLKMSELTSALERIGAWYQEKQSRSVFQPGLSRSAINDLVKDLAFPIPEEVYELYEWCNGSPDDSDAILFHQQYLLPLEEAVRWRQDRYMGRTGCKMIPPGFLFSGSGAAMHSTLLFWGVKKKAVLEIMTQNVRTIISIMRA